MVFLGNFSHHTRKWPQVKVRLLLKILKSSAFDARTALVVAITHALTSYYGARCDSCSESLACVSRVTFGAVERCCQSISQAWPSDRDHDDRSINGEIREANIGASTGSSETILTERCCSCALVARRVSRVSWAKLARTMSSAHRWYVRGYLHRQ